MVQSLLVWIALSLLANSGEARLWRGGRERITNGSPQPEGNINEYMCKVRNNVYVPDSNKYMDNLTARRSRITKYD